MTFQLTHDFDFGLCLLGPVPIVCNAVVLAGVPLGDLLVKVEHSIFTDHLIIESPEVVGFGVCLAGAQDLLAAEALLQNQSIVRKLNLLGGVCKTETRSNNWK